MGGKPISWAAKAGLTMRSKKREVAFSRSFGRCFYCGHPLAADSSLLPMPSGAGAIPDGTALFQIDHMMPRCMGGSDQADNLVAACGPCNSSKAGRTVEEYRAWLSKAAGQPVSFFGDAL